jgi:hypothetical protein
VSCGRGSVLCLLGRHPLPGTGLSALLRIPLTDTIHGPTLGPIHGYRSRHHSRTIHATTPLVAQRTASRVSRVTTFCRVTRIGRSVVEGVVCASSWVFTPSPAPDCLPCYGYHSRKPLTAPVADTIQGPIHGYHPRLPTQGTTHGTWLRSEQPLE